MLDFNELRSRASDERRAEREYFDMRKGIREEWLSFEIETSPRGVAALVALSTLTGNISNFPVSVDLGAHFHPLICSCVRTDGIWRVRASHDEIDNRYPSEQERSCLLEPDVEALDVAIANAIGIGDRHWGNWTILEAMDPMCHDEASVLSILSRLPETAVIGLARLTRMISDAFNYDAFPFTALVFGHCRAVGIDFDETMGADIRRVYEKFYNARLEELPRIWPEEVLVKLAADGDDDSIMSAMDFGAPVDVFGPLAQHAFERCGYPTLLRLVEMELSFVSKPEFPSGMSSLGYRLRADMDALEAAHAAAAPAEILAFVDALAASPHFREAALSGMEDFESAFSAEGPGDSHLADHLKEKVVPKPPVPKSNRIARPDVPDLIGAVVKAVGKHLGSRLEPEKKNVYATRNGTSLWFSCSSGYKGSDFPFFKLRPDHLSSDYFVVWMRETGNGWAIPTPALRRYLSGVPLSEREGYPSWDPRIGKVEDRIGLWTDKATHGYLDVTDYEFSLG